MIRTLCFVFFLASGFQVFSQTKEIRYKSHSGNMTHFTGQGEGDLGLREPEAVLVKMKKVNDTTFVGTYEKYSGQYTDTLFNDAFWMKPKKELDSLVQYHFPNVKLVGFDANSNKPKTSTPPPTPMQKESKSRKTGKTKRSSFIPITPTFPATPTAMLMLVLSLLAFIFFIQFKSTKNRPKLAEFNA